MNVENVGNRITWIDMAKSIGIILVVLGHTPIPNTLKHFIYSFHMPLFFFLSGYFFSVKTENILEFIKIKMKSILVPYFSFSFISFLVYIITNYKYFKNNKELLKQFVGIFYSNGDPTWMSWNIALWFLTCLFLVNIIFYITLKISRDRSSLIIIIILLSVIGWQDRLLQLPWSINGAFSYVLFFGLGKLYNENNEKIPLLKINRFELAAITLFLNILVNYILPSKLNFNHSSGYIIYNLTAVIGIISCIILSKLIPTNRLLLYIGRNSIVILALHNLIYIFIKWCIVNILKIPIIYTYNSSKWGILYTICELIVLLPIIYVINRYFQFLLGKRRNRLME